MSYKPNFKTDVHRTQTKKWADAKPVSYDDWGDDDDYGYEDEAPPPPMPKSTGFRQRGQGVGPQIDTSRSFTSPEYNAQLAAQAAAAPSLQRSTSFEAGEESRSFSAAAELPATTFSRNNLPSPSREPEPLSAPSLQGAYAAMVSSQIPSQEPNYPSRNTFQTLPAQSQMQSQIYDVGPAPLEPPRKSSRRKPSPDPPIISNPVPPQQDTGDQYYQQSEPQQPQEQKPLTFIRPADIYKRIEAERERERASTDSSRPSMDSVNRSAEPSVAALSAATIATGGSVGQGTGSVHQPNLSPVAERFGEYGAQGQQSRDISHSQQGSADSSTLIPSLPAVSRISGFGSDFWSFSGSGNSASTGFSPESSNTIDTTSPGPQSARSAASRSDTDKTISPGDYALQEKPSLGFRSAVEHAFEANDGNLVTSPRSTQGSQRSAAENSDYARTDSTADISPIIGNMPPESFAARRAYERGEVLANAPAPIAEESGSPSYRQTNAEGVFHSPSTPTAHTRNVSAESATTPIPSHYRRDMRPPSRNNSPARMLAIETRSITPRADAGFAASSSPLGEPQSQSASIQDQDSAVPDSAIPDSAITASSKYTDREADVAEAINRNSAPPSQELADAARAGPSEFMNSPHDYDEMTNMGSPFSSDPSTSKGRVKDLATQYDEIHHSRSQSPVGSVSSRTSNNIARTQVDRSSGSTAPPLGVASESTDQTTLAPMVEQAATLQRPQIPGGWMSYTDIEDSNTESRDIGTSHVTGSSFSAANEDPYDQPKPMTTSEGDIDFSPDTEKRVVPGHSYKDDSDSTGALAAAAAAGSAMAASMVAAVGLGGSEENRSRGFEPQNPAGPTTSYEAQDLEHLRPQPLHKNNKSFDSLAGPTPPPKDTPHAENSGQASSYFPPPLKDQQYTSPGMLDTSVGQQRQVSTAHMSIESSADDTENDRLAKDIVRNLSPTSAAPTSTVEHDRLGDSLAPYDTRTTDAQRASSVLPREYDSYWAGSPVRDTFNTSPLPDQSSARASGDQFDSSVREQPKSSPAPRPGLLDKRFSWEMEDEEEQLDRSTETAGHSEPAPLSSVAANRDLTASDEAAQFQEAPMRGDSLAPPQDASSPAQDQFGLGLQNTSGLPPPAHAKEVETHSGSAKSSAEYSHNASRPSTMDFSDTKFQHSTDQGYRSTAQPVGGVPALPNIMPLKDIMALKSSEGRVESCRSSREQLATADTGLSSWLVGMVESNPEHANAIASGVQRPVVSTGAAGLAGSVRNKIPPSLAKFTSKSSSPTNNQPYYQQYLDSAASVPGQSPTSASALQTSSSLAPVPEKRPQSGSAKGKDALKGFSSGAKGLFAKGKSKFKPPQEG